MPASAALALVAALAAAPSDESRGGASADYTRARSPHFEVLTDAGAPLARHAAEHLEALRAAFADLLPPRLTGERRIVAILLANRSRFERLAPRRYAQPRSLAGFFQSGFESDTIVARLALEPPGPYAALDHEYAHLALNRSLPAQPLWVAEGLAELLSDGALDGDAARFGARRPELEAQARAGDASLADLMRTGQDSPEYLGARGDGRLYGRAWALARFVVARHGLAALRAYLDTIAFGADPVAAFEDRFGPLAATETALFEVSPSPVLSAAVAAGPPPTSYAEDVPAAADVEQRFGDLLLAGGEPKRAQDHLERALAADPDQTAARISLAELRMRNGDRDGARRELARVLQRAPDEPGALLRSARLRVLDARAAGTALAPAEEDAIVAQLERALARAPGLYETALLLADLRPRPYASRLRPLELLFDQDPSRTEVALVIAALQAKQRNLAAAVSVLSRARDAAREPAYRFLCEHQLAQLGDYAAATTEARGRLVDLQCRPDGSLSFLVAAGRQVLRLEAESTRSFFVYSAGREEAEAEVRCGAQDRAVLIRFSRSSEEASGVQGRVLWLEFLERAHTRG
jgi:tetratricopeptide (TPR) repeat protein